MNTIFRKSVAVVMAGFLFFQLHSSFALAQGIRIVAPSKDQNLNFLHTQNILEKGETLQPNRFVSREQFVKMALRSQDLKGDVGTYEPFRDVENDSYIAQAWKLKIIKTALNFEPKRPITVQEALKVLFKTFQIEAPLIFDQPKTRWTDLPDDPEMRSILLGAIDFGIWNPISSDEIGVHQRLTGTDVENLFRKALTGQKAGDFKSRFDAAFEARQNARRDGEFQSDLFDYIWQVLHNQFYYQDKVVDEDLIQKSIDGMLESLGDKYTFYSSPQKAKNFNDEISGQLEGIGAQLDVNDQKEVFIARPLPGFPAAKGGLKAGDVILKVGDIDVLGQTTDEIAGKIKGPAGTEVTLVVRRGTQELSFTLKREKIELKYVEERIEDNTLIITVLLFGEDTAIDFREILEKYSEDKSLKGIIVDLRDNPGGDLNVVLSMLGALLPPDEDERNRVGVWEEQKDAFEKDRVRGDSIITDWPLAVLVNENSASASEIFAGVVQDYKRGIVIGSQTFGKGTAQKVVVFTDGSSLRYTFAKWLTPNKRDINGVGITPDIVLEQRDREDNILAAGKNAIKQGRAKSAFAK